MAVEMNDFGARAVGMVRSPNAGDFLLPCDCFDQYGSIQPPDTRFHGDVQDTECDGWKRLLELVELAAADGRAEFAPFMDMPIEQWQQVVTLPASIAKLKAVRHFVLPLSSLVRVPPEIGEMDSLERFWPYTSHRLHWFPYEITRCSKLTNTAVSTRSLYGNYKFRPPFPRLQAATSVAAPLDLSRLDPAVWGVDSVEACSVCGRSLAGGGVHQAWLSARVANDVLPLLVNACSATCLHKLPPGAEGYVGTLHGGGPGIQQPPPRY